MSADINSLLEKTEQDLQQYVKAIDGDHLKEFFAQMWDSVREMALFGGQSRSVASAEALSFSQFALSIATHSHSKGLLGEAHRMMAHALSANEQYERAITHYMEAIILLE